MTATERKIERVVSLLERGLTQKEAIARVKMPASTFRAGIKHLSDLLARYKRATAKLCDRCNHRIIGPHVTMHDMRFHRDCAELWTREEKEGWE